jgi:hypothetical protein
MKSQIKCDNKSFIHGNYLWLSCIAISTTPLWVNIADLHCITRYILNTRTLIITINVRTASLTNCHVMHLETADIYSGGECNTKFNKRIIIFYKSDDQGMFLIHYIKI